MKKILVPCDFSTPAINSFRFALDLAEESKGSVQLLHVIQLPVLHDTVLMPVLNFEEELLKELREKSLKQFEKLIEKYNKDKAKVDAEVMFGPVSTTIIDKISDYGADLVVMGSHGASGLKEMFIGSNAEKVVRTSPVPVLVLKDYYKGQIKNIVFPNTLETEHQEDLVMKVKALQHFFKATLHIVWINTPLNFTSDTLSHERLNAFAKRFMLKNFTINVFNHPNEETGILEFSKLVKADLIAMATHGRRGIAHFVNGSLAEDVVNHTKGLVWTYSLKNETVAQV